MSFKRLKTSYFEKYDFEKSDIFIPSVRSAKSDAEKDAISCYVIARASSYFRNAYPFDAPAFVFSVEQDNWADSDIIGVDDDAHILLKNIFSWVEAGCIPRKFKDWHHRYDELTKKDINNIFSS